jgi:hypothetical protein
LQPLENDIIYPNPLLRERRISAIVLNNLFDPAERDDHDVAKRRNRPAH